MMHREGKRKAMTERVLEGVRERFAMPKVQDALGARGAQLAKLLEMAHVPDIHEGRIHDVGESDVFPVIVLEPSETIVSHATGMMNLQKNWLGAYLRTVWTRDGEMFDETDVAYAIDDADTLPQELSLDVAGQYEVGKHSTAARRRFDVRNPDGVQVLSRGRPHILLRTQRDAHQMANSLTHELSHALDVTTTPMWCYEEARQLQRLVLASELAAYATEVTIAHVLDAQHAWLPRRRMNLTAEQVEMIRCTVNGPYDSRHAFDPNEKVEWALAQKKLGFIYQKYD